MSAPIHGDQNLPRCSRCHVLAASLTRRLQINNLPKHKPWRLRTVRYAHYLPTGHTQPLDMPRGTEINAQMPHEPDRPASGQQLWVKCPPLHPQTRPRVGVNLYPNIGKFWPQTKDNGTCVSKDKKIALSLSTLFFVFWSCDIWALHFFFF